MNTNLKAKIKIFVESRISTTDYFTFACKGSFNFPGFTTVDKRCVKGDSENYHKVAGLVKKHSLNMKTPMKFGPTLVSRCNKPIR